MNELESDEQVFGLAVQETYTLPDAELLHDTHSVYRQLAWVPSCTMIVLGFGDEWHRSLRLDAIANANLPVVRRPTGGETVLLSPNMAVIAAVRHATRLPPVSEVFRRCNQKIIRVITSLGAPAATCAGISDIAIAGQKIAGSAIYRTRARLFFHAVINVAEASATIAHFLAAPQRPPAYRQGRPHETFVTSLHAQGCLVSPASFAMLLQHEFADTPF